MGTTHCEYSRSVCDKAASRQTRLLTFLLQEFYIPLQSSSIHFLKTKLCVGCPNGFEIVDLETLDTQGLLDPADESLDFVRRRESTLKPMAIYRIENEFLLCYDGRTCRLASVVWF